MAFLRLAMVLLPCLIASAALAESTNPSAPPTRHVVSAPATPIREAPPHRPRRHGERCAQRPRERHPAKEETVAKPKEQKPKEQKTEAAKPRRRAAPPPNPNIGTVTGLPLPRFASLRADEVNFRAGPGDRYPVEWIYRRRGLPVEIEREFDVWRLVVAPDGTKGWAHEATLMGRRDFVVTGTEHTMRASPQEDARPVAVLKPGVVGGIADCPAHSEWCRVQVRDYRGWIRRDDIWGVLPGEAVASR